MTLPYLKLSPAWIAYGEALDPSRHYVVRLMATGVDSTEDARNAFLRKLSELAGLEIPLLYKSAPVAITAPWASLTYAPASSSVKLPENAKWTWAFLVQAVDGYVTPTLLTAAAYALDSRVVAALIERMPPQFVTEATLEGSEDPASRELLAQNAARPYPYDLALIPDRGYTATFYFTSAMPSRRDLAAKISELGLEYIDPSSEIEAKLTAEGRMTALFATTGYPPTPRALAAKVGAQSVYIDRKMVISAEDAKTVGRIGFGEDLINRITGVSENLAENTVDVAEIAVADFSETFSSILTVAKWTALVGLGILGGALLGKSFNYARGKNR
jgi:hypothetical protein